ncbi:FAD-dependent oxidoreductase [Paenibacillus hodogayensis]|uniref:FAD-dependent oxidoreductase n=1 Tax=Paenibacillus hodogayensis TaxID=279208 RepID=A0ABV5VY54_9BACL
MLIHIPSVPLLHRTDIAVVGSGSAGVTAAIAAAREGKRVTLVERYGFLGGTSTGVLDTFYGFYTPGRAARKVVGGVPDDMLRRLYAEKAAFERPNTFGAGTGITYDPETLKWVWEDLATEAGVQLLYHSFCTDVVMDGNKVAGIVTDGKRGLMRIDADVVIDCSGDADVAFRAGVPFERAGEGSAAQTLTTTFRLANVDGERAKQVPRKRLVEMMKEANRSGRYHLPREEGSIHATPVAGVMLAIMTRLDGYDPCDPVSLTAAEIEGRRQVREYVRFLVNEVPGYEQARLVALSTQIGVRETRRIYGEYRLTKEDVTAVRKFGDTIGQCGAPIEDHHGGNDTHWEFLPEGAAYDIPFRSLVPQQAEGLLVAGRCFSATHEAHASCRSMAQCMAMGQAAGVAAAIAAGRDALPRHVDIGQVQQRLVDTGAILYDWQSRDGTE